MVKCFLFSPTATTDISQLGTEQLHLIEYSDSGNEIFHISADKPHVTLEYMKCGYCNGGTKFVILFSFNLNLNNFFYRGGYVPGAQVRSSVSGIFG